MHFGQCKDNSFCRNGKRKTNTKFASLLADADNYSHNELKITQQNFYCQFEKCFCENGFF